MLNAVQQSIKGILNGMTSPQMQPLQAVIMPPEDVDIALAPIAYIWAADLDVKRVSAPRPKGWQRFTWAVDVALLAAMEIDDPNTETAFPLLLDQISATIAQVPMPYVLTDTVTGFQTQVMKLGEEWKGAYAQVRTTGGTGVDLLRFGCELTLSVEEDVSFLGGYP